MIKKILLALSLVTVFGGTALAATAGVVDPGADPIGFFGFLYQKLQSGEYFVVFGAALVGIVWALRSVLATKIAWLKTRLGGWVLAFASAGLLAVGTAMAAGQVVSMSLMSAAFTAALVASGGWGALKDILGLSGPAETDRK